MINFVPIRVVSLFPQYMYFCPSSEPIPKFKTCQIISSFRNTYILPSTIPPLPPEEILPPLTTFHPTSPPPPLHPHLINPHNPPPNTLGPRRHLLHRRLPKATNPKIPLPKTKQLPLLITPNRPRRHRRRRRDRHRRRHLGKVHRLRHPVRTRRQRRPRRRLFRCRRTRLSHALRLDGARVVLDEHGGLVLGRDVGAVVGRLVGGLAGGLEDAAVDARVGNVEDDAIAGGPGGAVRGGGDVGDEDVGEGVDLRLGVGAAADGDRGAGPRGGGGGGLEGSGGGWDGGGLTCT